jgi:hypothetical protein
MGMQLAGAAAVPGSAGGRSGTPGAMQAAPSANENTWKGTPGHSNSGSTSVRRPWSATAGHLRSNRNRAEIANRSHRQDRSPQERGPTNKGDETPRRDEGATCRSRTITADRRPAAEEIAAAGRSTWPYFGRPFFNLKGDLPGGAAPPQTRQRRIQTNLVAKVRLHVQGSGKYTTTALRLQSLRPSGDGGVLSLALHTNIIFK